MTAKGEGADESGGTGRRRAHESGESTARETGEIWMRLDARRSSLLFAPFRENSSFTIGLGPLSGAEHRSFHIVAGEEAVAVASSYAFPSFRRRRESTRKESTRRERTDERTVVCLNKIEDFKNIHIHRALRSIKR